MQATSKSLTEGRELVVLVHGICSSRLVLWPLGRRLEKQGFAVRYWDYLSIFRSNRTYGQRFANDLAQLAASGEWSRIHLVVHSMGSIVARCAFEELDEHVRKQLGRVVMIGPPNGGSHRATLLRHVYGFVPPLVELTDLPDSFVNRLPPPPEEIEFGVIAASHDNVIHPDKTHLDGERDHETVRGWHVSVLHKARTAELTANFLRSGRFEVAA